MLLRGSSCLFAEESAAPVKQTQLYWQHCGFITTQPGSSNPGTKPASAPAVLVSLQTWQQLAGMLSQQLPRTDEFEGSDAAIMAALAFTVEVLKYPFEMLCPPDAAVLCVVTSAVNAAAPAAAQVADGCQDGDNAHAGEKPGTQTGSPDGALRGQSRVHNCKPDGGSPQCSRTAAPIKASTDKQTAPSSSANTAVELSGQGRMTEVEVETLRAFGVAWKALYKALHEVSVAALLTVSVCLHHTADYHREESDASCLAIAAEAHCLTLKPDLVTVLTTLFQLGYNGLG